MGDLHVEARVVGDRRWCKYDTFAYDPECPADSITFRLIELRMVEQWSMPASCAAKQCDALPVFIPRNAAIDR